MVDEGKREETLKSRPIECNHRGYGRYWSVEAIESGREEKKVKVQRISAEKRVRNIQNI
jgi:hypothetical protein